MSDNSKWKILPTNEFYQYMFQCLLFAVGEFEDKCYQSLEFEEEFKQYEFYSISNGTDNEFEIDLLSYGINLLDYETLKYNNGEFKIYVGARKDDNECYKEINEFTYVCDGVNNPIITLPVTPSCNLDIYIVIYKIGKFKEDLKQKVINVLATGCEVPFLNEKMVKNELLHQKTFSNTVKGYSQAQHISSVKSVYESIYFKNFKSEIVKYTYDYAENFDELGSGKDGYIGDTLWH